MKLHYMQEKQFGVSAGDWVFDAEYDVVVLGLGTAGAPALISAARQGLRVLGVEPLSYMGGIGTGGGIHSYYFGSKGGLQEEINARCDADKDHYCSKDVQSFHPDLKKYVLETMALEAGAEIWYQHMLSGVFVDDKKVCGLQILGPSGTLNVRCAYLIDASGDAHAAAMAGCAYRFGRDADGYPQPYSFIRGVTRKNGGIHGNNFDVAYVDPRDPDEMNAAVLAGNALHCFEEFNQDNALTSISSHFGLREGRFIIGEETVSFEDVIFERKRDNLVMQSYSHYDNHSNDWAYESVLGQEWVLVANFFRRPQVADVPSGIFIPQGWTGILIAGRSVSLDHDSHQGIRMQREMQKFGEITATMAAMSIHGQYAAKDIPIAELQEKLMASGCLSKVGERLQHEPWLSDEKSIWEGLSSMKPGVAIWSCRLLGDLICPALKSYLNSDNKVLVNNAAYALGLLRQREALPVLISMIEENEPTVPFTHSRERDWTKFAPIFMVGLIADVAAEDCLMRCLSSVQNNAVTASHVMVSLLRIADKNIERRVSIVDILHQFLEEKQKELLLSMWNNAGTPMNVINIARIYLLRQAQRWGIELNMKICPTSAREERMLALA